MPTVATSHSHFDLFDVRGGAATQPFFFDAEELCCNSLSYLGLDNHLVTGSLLSSQPRQFGKMLPEGDGGESDCLLLGSHSDDDLSPGHSHHGNAAAMQFLLLDDDEAMCNAPMAAAPEPACKIEAPAACLPAATSVHLLIRQHSDSSVPYVDSSTMYCLAVVDEATGLPLRPATPEETWEVERCFVLQQQSELDAGLPMEQQQQCCRAGSASVSETKDEDSVLLVPEQEEEKAEELPEPEQPEEEAKEEEKEEKEEEKEEEAEAEEVAPVRPNKRPEQPQRRCGPCDNCGATESPQWRQGPASKPLLCNACGMRFRRTNQLVAGETGTASGARGGARAHKKAPAAAAPAAAAAAPLAPRQKTKQVAPPPVPQLPDAKRPRRAAAVAAAATVAAAIDACS